LALKIPCPNCGPRPYTEFSFGGEVRMTSPVLASGTDRVAQVACELTAATL
jgi:sarcosine oxidase delta subunit